MNRGSVYWVNLESSAPSKFRVKLETEFGKIRPGLIVSNSDQNTFLPTVVIIPLSSKEPEIWPLRIKLNISTKSKPSFAVVPGIRQVDKSRLLKKIGNVSSKLMQELDQALQSYLRD